MATRSERKPKKTVNPARCDSAGRKARPRAVVKPTPPEPAKLLAAPAPAAARSHTPAEPPPARDLTPHPVPAAEQREEEVVLVFCPDTDVANVSVAGSFNGWCPETHPMKQINPKTYVAMLKLAPGEYQYKFVVDGTWVEDPTARKYVPDGHGANNSVLMV